VQLRLLADREQATDRARFVWEILKARGQRLVKDNQPIEGDEANLATLRERLATHDAGPVRILNNLRVR